MNLSLFTAEGFVFLLRWMHFFFGVAWIGLLYYFNFIQGPFFNETDAATKSNAIQKLVPRALWWFRWGAVWTMASGLAILGYRGHQSGAELFATPWGIWILTGALLGIIMGLNVWGIIWRNQKIIIASATQAAQGKGPLPEAAAAAAKAGLASRTNVLFSIPMLFFMGAASHLPLMMSETTNYMALTIAILVIVGALELNAIKGKLGPLTTVKGVITCGFVLTAVLYAVIEIIA